MSGRVLERNEIRDRFVELRERLGWSVTQAAEELGVDQPTVSQWEKGTRAIPMRHREAIARRAGEPVTYLVANEEEAVSRDVRDRLIAAEWMQRMADRLREEARAATSTDGDGSHDVAAAKAGRDGKERRRPRRARGDG
jgi:transcriptional regulator with XRE-family HTH domain